MANPTLLDMPIARDGNKNAIPTTDNGTTGLLSQQYGWQLINAIPPQQGGKAVKREDFNGALYLLSNLLFYLQKGWQFEFDENQNYYAGCVIKDTDGNLYQCIADVSASSTHPKDDDGTHWVQAPAMLGYRKNSNAYVVGDIAYSTQLPAGWFLICATAGTTASIEPTITPTWLGAVTDGTVVWHMQAPTHFALNQRKDSASHNRLLGGTSVNDGAWLDLRGKDMDGAEGAAVLSATDGINQFYLSLLKNGKLYLGSNDNYSLNACVNDSLIVNASLSVNGYIKFGNGFLMQWGEKTLASNGATAINFGIDFANANYILIASPRYNAQGAGWTGATIGVEPYTKSLAYIHSGIGKCMWLAIGKGE